MQILTEGSSPFSLQPGPSIRESTGDREAQLREKGLEYPEGRRRAEGSSTTEWQGGQTLREEQGKKKKLGQSKRNQDGEREKREVEEKRKLGKGSRTDRPGEGRR